MTQSPASWYFDFISPFAYLQFASLKELADDLKIELKPVLVSALLEHWGQKGPAEIPPKRRFVYRFFKWQADRRGVSFKMPAVHPFNPLPPLRLAIAAGSGWAAVHAIFHFIYGEGRNINSDETLAELAALVGIANSSSLVSDKKISGMLRANTEQAISQGVFGVPTIVVDQEIFWGDDATPMLKDYLRDRNLLRSDEMQRISNLPMGLVRSSSKRTKR
jgi:2-hydroxychromene-2-carboxylate isomerase